MQMALEKVCQAYTTARQEVSILQTVHHPHIVPLLGFSRKPLALIIVSHHYIAACRTDGPREGMPGLYHCQTGSLYTTDSTPSTHSPIAGLL